MADLHQMNGAAVSTVHDAFAQSYVVVDDYRVDFLYRDTKYLIMSDSHFWTGLRSRSLPGRRKRSRGTKPIICGPQAGVDKIRHAFNIQNLYRVKVGDAAQKWFIAPGDDEKDNMYRCPLHFHGIKCRLGKSFPDNYEWNEYARIALRFGLFKHPIRQVLKWEVEYAQADLDRKLGFPGDKSITKEELLNILFDLEPKQTTPDESREKILMTFIPIGAGVALLCFALESLPHCVSRG